MIREAMNDAHPLLGALASIEYPDRARVRMVVIRRFDPANMTLALSTDVRSAKISQFRRYSVSEMCIWLSEPRVSLRLLTRWSIQQTPADSSSDQSGLDALWHAHSSASKAIFFTPPPGMPYHAVRKTRQQNSIPDTFAILSGEILEIDALQISHAGHTRWHHVRSSAGKWIKRRVNP
ncbi:MAG: hypothetical protein ACP5O1_00925 [Phycisphaerae bacterium]